jgi:hypothetical protein
MKSLKQKVVEFLQKLNGSPEEQFNTALNFYRSSTEANAGLVRHYNVAGFNQERLDNLIYDLKQAYGITAADLASKAKVVKMNVTTTSKGEALPAGFPEFSKGTKGNAERRAYLKEHGLESASKKSADMDEVIKKHLRDLEAEKVVDETLVEEVKSNLDSDPIFSPELLDKVAKSNEVTRAAIDAILPKGTPSDAPSPEDIAFNKLAEVIKAEGDAPISLVRELYNDKDMTDNDAETKILAAKKVLELPEDLNSEVNADKISKENETDIQKNGTDVSKSETKVAKSETDTEDSEKK